MQFFPLVDVALSVWILLISMFLYFCLYRYLSIDPIAQDFVRQSTLGLIHMHNDTADLVEQSNLYFFHGYRTFTARLYVINDVIRLDKT